MRICFDMDGTLANLYGVEGWLESLRAEDATPYAVAEVMVNMNALARRLNALQRAGHKVVVVSWLSKNGSAEYGEAVTEAKKAWLAKHLKSVKFDEVNIVEYGTPKSVYAESADDILFDDEERNRTEWTGKAYGVEDILGTLKKI